MRNFICLLKFCVITINITILSYIIMYIYDKLYIRTQLYTELTFPILHYYNSKLIIFVWIISIADILSISDIFFICWKCKWNNYFNLLIHVLEQLCIDNDLIKQFISMMFVIQDNAKCTWFWASRFVLMTTIFEYLWSKYFIYVFNPKSPKLIVNTT